MDRTSCKKIKVILITSGFSVPNSASYNRNLAIQKIVGDLFVYELVCLFNSEFKSGRFEKIKRHIYILSRLYLIKKIIRYEGFKYVIFLRTVDPLISFFAWIFTRSGRVKLAIERNEFPEVLRNNNKFRFHLYRYFVLSWHYRLFDVIFLMTDALIEFYKPYVKKNCIIQKLPMTVDLDRFENISERESSQYIFYAGSLDETKDGVESLISAFSIIAEKFPELNLRIAGGSKNGERELRLEQLILRLKMEDRIELLGMVERTEIPFLIKSAKILALPRPESKQAEGGFPTKLGEYLASGKPVIVSDIGEIPGYLSNDEVYFISRFNIIEDLADRIREIMLDYNSALKKADLAKEKASKVFSLEANKSIIKSVFESLPEE